MSTKNHDSDKNCFSPIIIKVERIINSIIFDKFKCELQRTLRKYPDKSLFEIVKLLFHGTKSVAPSEIYSGEYGLDNRFA